MIKKIFLFTILYIFTFSLISYADGFIVMGPGGTYTLSDGSTVDIDDNGIISNSSVDYDVNEEDKDEDEENTPSNGLDLSGNINRQVVNNRSNPTSNLIINEELSEELQITIPFSDLESIEGNGTQLDLYGIGMVPTIYQVAGNRTYLGNDILLNDFYQWLEKAKYNTSSLKLLIEKIKTILGVISGTLSGETHMIFDEDVISSIDARKVRTTTMRASKIIEVIFIGLGVLFILYGFLLVLSWIFDKTLLPFLSETGLAENGLVGLITFGHLRADDERIDDNSVTFWKMCLFAFGCIIVGVLILSPTLREILKDFIVTILNKFN